MTTNKAILTLPSAVKRTKNIFVVLRNNFENKSKAKKDRQKAIKVENSDISEYNSLWLRKRKAMKTRRTSFNALRVTSTARRYTNVFPLGTKKIEIKH